MSTEPNAANGEQAQPTEASAKSSPPPPEPLEAVVEVKPVEKPDPQAELGRMRDQLLRAAADFDNYRKRSRKEQEDASRRGRESAIKDLLPVFDNLERAASHAESAQDAKVIGDGVRMVIKQFVDTLDRMGVKRVPTVGHPFDPSMHEAIQHLESKDHPAGVILAEVQPGYSIGDYLLRAAMVVVSKGAPQGEPAAAS